MIRYRLRTLLILLAIGPPMLAYVGSYYVLSRRGYAYTDSLGAKGGFWFVPPDSETDIQMNARYDRFYWPLIQLEILAGSQRRPLGRPCNLRLS